MTYVGTNAKELLALVPETSEIFRTNSGFGTGAPFTKSQYERRLASMLKALDGFMSNYPRTGDESLPAYIDRAKANMSMSGITDALKAAAVCRDNIARLEVLEAADREREENDREAERQREHRSIVMQSKPDPVEVKRLLKVIEAASAHEELLSDICAALTAHHQAQNARSRIRHIFSSAQSACNRLHKSPPLCPDVTDAPAGAVELASRTVRRRRDGHVEE